MPVVPQVLISLLYIDSYASVYGMIEVLRGNGNPMPFDCVAWPAGYIVSLYNSGVGALQIGIRAGLPVGNPFYWSMSSLVL